MSPGEAMIAGVGISCAMAGWNIALHRWWWVVVFCVFFVICAVRLGGELKR